MAMADTSLPLKLCSHRWLENAAPAERALEILPNVMAYCSAAKSRTVSEPNCKSYEEILRMIDDPLLKAKLQFFIAVAHQVEPFLEKYQSDAPLLPFLATDLGQLVKYLMARFVKADLVDACNSVASLSKVEFQKKECQKDPSKFDIGFSAQQSLRILKITDEQRMSFQLECRDFLVAVLNKMDKAPIKSKLVRSLTWLDPQQMSKTSTEAKEKRLANLDVTLRLMAAARRVKPNQCDVVRREYTQFCDEILAEYSSDFRTASPGSAPLSYSWKSEKFASLWALVKQLLLLSHGQATVERGFSMNKEASVDNLQQKSVIVRRHIMDCPKNVESLATFPLTKELLCYASSARRKYEEYLLECKKAEENKATEKKRKAEEEDQILLKAKRRKLAEDIASLEASADKMALDAEVQSNMQMLMQSNALRRKVQDKKQELKVLNDKI